MSSEPRLLALVLALVGALAGCDPDACVRHGDCAEGLVCGPRGACIVPPVEPPDGGDADAGVPDAAAADASGAIPQDASLPDAAPPDA